MGGGQIKSAEAHIKNKITKTLKNKGTFSSYEQEVKAKKSPGEQEANEILWQSLK